MTEYGKRRSDESVTELEQMESINLFDKARIKAIAKKRKEFEYKIKRRTNCQDDYVHYIQHELDILKRVEEAKDKCAVTRKKVELAITNRVDKLFLHVINQFQSDVRLWTSYIRFCKQKGRIASASAILVKMVTAHKDKPNVWKMAANWEFEECHSIENSRKYLLRGLRLHPKSKVLYEEAFRQELNYADMKRKAKFKEEETTSAGEASNTPQSSSPLQMPGDPSDKILEGRHAEGIYETAILKVDNVQFYVDLLSIAKEFDFTDRLQNRIVNHLLSKYRNDELSWDTMARRELEGFTYSAQTFDESSPTMPSSPSDKKKTSLKERIRLCITVYTAVVKQLNTERMWSLYLETLIELNQDLVNLPTFKQNLLKTAFQDAHNAGRLQEKYYLQWVDLLQSTSKFKKLGLVLRQATERFSSNVELWQMRLRFHLARDEETLGVDVFRLATARLGNDNEATLPLWKNMIQYYQTKDIDKAEKTFENGIKLGTSVSYSLKPLFLDWLLLMKGISAVRKEYEFLSLQLPLCLKLHLKMIALENMQPDMNVKHMRKCYEVACTQFGRENYDLWVEYAKFELNCDELKNYKNVHDRAMETLDSFQVDMFLSEFALLQNSIPTPTTTPTA